MRIFITPEDIIKRGMWDYYTYYIVGDEKKAIELLNNNEEFLISERDAKVCGLLASIETDNLIYRFNDYLVNIINIKSIKENSENGALIKKKTIELVMDNFYLKFPSYWNPPLNYKAGIKDMTEYIETLKNVILNGGVIMGTSKHHKPCKIIMCSIQNIEYEFYSANAIKKLLNFNNY